MRGKGQSPTPPPPPGKFWYFMKFNSYNNAGISPFISGKWAWEVSFPAIWEAFRAKIFLLRANPRWRGALTVCLWTWSSLTNTWLRFCSRMRHHFVSNQLTFLNVSRVIHSLPSPYTCARTEEQ
ncbi:hypothetical protein HOLleu_02413 [Holothuria leucospilota]|uniref:Uncharacterized protein n=1 Tax=Holothuria leucospilota TaxID=206669 RepID=A0A9Q1HLE7_HOLLE|nr:hypothetical protein HOLleu_02413 [Holothuria leucospilota]